jgi:hypothetical protein
LREYPVRGAEAIRSLEKRVILEWGELPHTGSPSVARVMVRVRRLLAGITAVALVFGGTLTGVDNAVKSAIELRELAPKVAQELGLPGPAEPKQLPSTTSATPPTPPSTTPPTP